MHTYMRVANSRHRDICYGWPTAVNIVAWVEPEAAWVVAIHEFPHRKKFCICINDFYILCTMSQQSV